MKKKHVHGTLEGDVFLSGRIQIESENHTLSEFIHNKKHGKCNFKTITFNDCLLLSRGDKIKLKNDKYFLRDLYIKGRITQSPPEYEFIRDNLGQELTVLESDDDDITPLKVGLQLLDISETESGVWIPLQLVEAITYIKKRK